MPGVFKLQKQMTSEAALAALLDPANKMENTAQLREGLTVDAVAADARRRRPGCRSRTSRRRSPIRRTTASAPTSLEGWLFPATYTFDPGVTAPQVIQTLVDRTVQSLDDRRRAGGQIASAS